MWKTPKPGEILEGNQQFEGYSMDLIDYIAKNLTFSYIFELVPDNAYGSYNPKTKEWNGLIRQLLERVRLAIDTYLIAFITMSHLDIYSNLLITNLHF